MKIFIIILTIFISLNFYGESCITFQASHNCSSNHTIINAYDENISFNAHAKWNNGIIEYKIKKGSEILQIYVTKEENYLILRLNYHNKGANLRIDPQTGHFDAENVNDFLNLISVTDQNFLSDIRNFIYQMDIQSPNTDPILDLYNMLSNPIHANFARGGMIMIRGIDPGVAYAVCWYSCMAGCIYGGGRFDDCSTDCWNNCKDLL